MAGDVVYRQFCDITAAEAVKVGLLGEILLFNSGRAEREVNLCDPCTVCSACFFFYHSACRASVVDAASCELTDSVC